MVHRLAFFLLGHRLAIRLPEMGESYTMIKDNINSEGSRSWRSLWIKDKKTYKEIQLLKKGIQPE